MEEKIKLLVEKLNKQKDLIEKDFIKTYWENPETTKTYFKEEKLKEIFFECFDKDEYELISLFEIIDHINEEEDDYDYCDSGRIKIEFGTKGLVEKWEFAIKFLGEHQFWTPNEEFKLSFEFSRGLERFFYKEDITDKEKFLTCLQHEKTRMEAPEPIKLLFQRTMEKYLSGVKINTFSFNFYTMKYKSDNEIFILINKNENQWYRICLSVRRQARYKFDIIDIKITRNY